MAILAPPRQTLHKRAILAPAHPFAKNLLTWYLAQPWMFPGITWFDLLNVAPLSLVNISSPTSTTGFNPTQRIGGRGELILNGTTGALRTTGPQLGMLNNLPVFSTSAWIYPTSAGGSSLGVIVFKRNAGGWSFRIGSASLDLQVFIQYATTPIQVSTPTNFVTLNKWQHVMMTWDGSATAANVHIYRDGIEATSYPTQQSGVGTRTDDSGSTLIFGDNVINGGTGANFQGSIDDMRIYTRVVSPGEVFAQAQHAFQDYKGLLVLPRRLFVIGMQGTTLTATPARMQWRASTPIVQRGISFDAASTSNYQTAQSTYSWNHTCTGTNRYLTVGISMLSVAGSSVSSITYNGVALSPIGDRASVSGAVRAELWGLVAPASGTHAISVTLSAPLDSIGNAVSFQDVNQTVADEAENDATATNVGAADAAVTVTTIADNDWVVNVVATDDTSITVGAGQTQRENVAGTLGTGAMATVGPQTPAAAVTTNWTNVGALATWSIVGVALRPLTAVGAATIEATPSRVQWQAETPRLTQTIVVQPAKMQWQASTPVVRSVVNALAAREQWQAQTLTIPRTVAASPAQAQWRAQAPTITRTLAIAPSQEQWQAATPQLTRTLVVQPAKMQWQTPTQSAVPGVTLQAAKMQWRAQSVSATLILVVQPAKMQWAAQTPVASTGGRTITVSPSQEQWQAETPRLTRTITVQPAQVEWRAQAPASTRIIAASPAQVQWRGQTPAVTVTLRASPAQQQWRAQAPVVVRAFALQPSQMQWQAQSLRLMRNVTITPARLVWMAQTPVLSRTPAQTATVSPAQMQWMAQAQSFSLTAVVAVPYARTAPGVILQVHQRGEDVSRELRQQGEAVVLGMG